MKKTNRQHPRQATDFEVNLYWEDGAGQACSTKPRARDASEAGMCLESTVAIEVGIVVYMDVPRYGSPLEATVRHCRRVDKVFRIGLEFSEETKRTTQGILNETDYYEVLQLSPKADMETVHRVYRIMAARFHPDNPESGDQERFLVLSEAYRILSDVENRARYDAIRGTEKKRPMPLFQARAFVDEKQGEINRRLGVMCLLYAQRRRNNDHPTVSLLELEELMSIPREYLEFTLWYLKEKQFVKVNDGADFGLTAEGVDYVEEHTPAHAMMRKLLNCVGATSSTDKEQAAGGEIGLSPVQ